MRLADLDARPDRCERVAIEAAERLFDDAERIARGNSRRGKDKHVQPGGCDGAPHERPVSGAAGAEQCADDSEHEREADGESD
jgi:hypothetical protein